MRTLMLLRHAQTEDVRPGFSDHARRLSAQGEEQASAIGAYLRARPEPVDLIVCSSATRAQQTAAALGSAAPLVVSDRLYNAGGDEILAVLSELEDDVEHVLVVGHAPGLPALVHELLNPDTSDPQALAAIEWRFPAGTLAELSVTTPWADLETANLLSVRLP